jgi:hypothetical protein
MGRGGAICSGPRQLPDRKNVLPIPAVMRKPVAKSPPCVSANILRLPSDFDIISSIFYFSKVNFTCKLSLKMKPEWKPKRAVDSISHVIH